MKPANKISETGEIFSEWWIEKAESQKCGPAFFCYLMMKKM